MSNFIIAVIRTLIPIVVGWVVALLVSAGIHIDTDLAAGLIVSLSTLVASLYYIGVAWLERKWPWFGWLLGVARNPVYSVDHLSGSTALSTMTTGQLRSEIHRRGYES